MTTSTPFVFDASPLITGCQFVLAGRSVAARVLLSTQAVIPPAVYTEVVTRGGTRPDALEAARLVRTGQLQVAAATQVTPLLADLQHYALGQGEQEAMTLAASFPEAIMVTDDFLALIVAQRLGVTAQLFLDFLLRQVRHGALAITEAHQILQVVSPRYPRGFIPHTLAVIRRFEP